MHFENSERPPNDRLIFILFQEMAALKLNVLLLISILLVRNKNRTLDATRVAESYEEGQV